MFSRDLPLGGTWKQSSPFFLITPTKTLRKEDSRTASEWQAQQVSVREGERLRGTNGSASFTMISFCNLNTHCIF